MSLSSSLAAALAVRPALGGAGAGEAKGKGGRLLILGGTGFLGPHIVDAARRRGFAITLFNRGKTNPGLFPDVQTLHGDRDGGLDVLRGQSWDAVVDTSGYVPRLVRASAEALQKSVGRYVFISSISVYKDVQEPPDITSPVRRLADEKIEKIEASSYGALKALCEAAAERAMPGRVINLRPGFIVGPRDPSDRFTYWPTRVERGGDMLAPGSPRDPIQIIDARDLAAWIVHLIERRHKGLYNAVGPAETLTMGELLRVCQSVTGKPVRLTWVGADFLERKEVQLPIWVPAQGEDAGFARISPRPAIEQGLRFRPLAETVKDTLDYWHSLPAERRDKPRAGLTAAREAELLALWRQSSKTEKPAARTEKGGQAAPPRP